ncbi:hypothetical protein CUR178_03094 [Leishmania enriettii]|uniref:Uncharacterized protein n=1 Tax=Leishmania enriettii TaxID=5663 RepID=A0A836GWG6_LEIEN|nr:hypothetical protein CUR178_03094 [Leishmania enriettii]
MRSCLGEKLVFSTDFQSDQKGMLLNPVVVVVGALSLSECWHLKRCGHLRLDGLWHGAAALCSGRDALVSWSVPTGAIVRGVV